MNKNFKEVLWVLEVTCVMILIIPGVIIGFLELNIYMENNECLRLEELGYKTIVIQEGMLKDCKIFYKGTFFDSTESESILALKLYDALHAIGETKQQLRDKIKELEGEVQQLVEDKAGIDL